LEAFIRSDVVMGVTELSGGSQLRSAFAASDPQPRATLLLRVLAAALLNIVFAATLSGSLVAARAQPADVRLQERFSTCTSVRALHRGPPMSHSGQGVR